MTVYEPERLCVAGKACRAWDPTGGPDQRGQAGETHRHALCHVCLDAAAHAIRLLPADWRDLEQQLPPAMGVWGEGPKGAGKEPPIPLNTAVEALQAGIWRACTAWEEIARDVAQLADPPHRRPSPPVRYWVADPAGTVTAWQRPSRVEHPSMQATRYRPGPIDVVRAVRVLVPRLGLLSDQPPVELVDYPMDLLVGSLERRRGRQPDERWDSVRQFRGSTYATVPGWLGVLDLAALHRRASTVLGLTRPVRRLPGVCPARGCGREDLRQDPPRFRLDEQPVYCGSCGLVMTYDDYRRRVDVWKVTA